MKPIIIIETLRLGVSDFENIIQPFRSSETRHLIKTIEKIVANMAARYDGKLHKKLNRFILYIELLSRFYKNYTCSVL